MHRHGDQHGESTNCLHLIGSSIDLSARPVMFMKIQADGFGELVFGLENPRSCALISSTMISMYVLYLHFPAFPLSADSFVD